MKIGRWLLLALVLAGAGFFVWRRYLLTHRASVHFVGRSARIAGSRRSENQSRSAERDEGPRTGAQGHAVSSRSRVRCGCNGNFIGAANAKRSFSTGRIIRSGPHSRRRHSTRKSNPDPTAHATWTSPCSSAVTGGRRFCRSTRSCPHAAAMSLPRLFRIATSTPRSRISRANAAIC